jgi:hypothetical protein
VAITATPSDAFISFTSGASVAFRSHRERGVDDAAVQAARNVDAEGRRHRQRGEQHFAVGNGNLRFLTADGRPWMLRQRFEQRALTGKLARTERGNRGAQAARTLHDRHAAAEDEEHLARCAPAHVERRTRRKRREPEGRQHACQRRRFHAAEERVVGQHFRWRTMM